MSFAGIDESDGRIGTLVNYSGEFLTGSDYRKFDFVYSTGDRLYYYAKEDISFGGGASVSDDQRFALLPSEAGPNAHYIVDTFNRPDDVNATFRPGNIINIGGSTGSNDGSYKIINVTKDYVSSTVENLTGAAIKIWGTSDSSVITDYEPVSSNVLTISTVDAYPSSNPDVWSNNQFFFDADYGSSINFRANNIRHKYGNGYFMLESRGINSLTFEANLKFNNRTNRESNAIIHFVENHLGQLEGESASPNLSYKQGISGFRWDGNAMFNPYRSTENETKTFYCTQFNHSLNFEDSNDVDLVLRNLNTSLLRKSEQLFIQKAETYDPTVMYERHDVVFYTGNNEYYYWDSDISTSNKPPAEAGTGFAGVEKYIDLNTSYWTRDFNWKPSIGLSISHKPRMNEISVGGGYTQVYEDGINENLLELNLEFKNRSDEEAKSILHYLEQKLGCKPFRFTPPSPYDRTQNFICEQWSHVYNYKNSHTISATFEQYPFNFSAEQYTNIDTPPDMTSGELIFSSPISFSLQDEGEKVVPGEKAKARVLFKNIGDHDVELYSAIASSRGVGTFNVLGQTGNNNLPFVYDNLTRNDYVFQLPAAGFPLGLNGKFVKLSKSYTPGIADGGQLFTVVTGTSDPFNYKSEIVNGVPNSFFQNNRGQIKSGINENINVFYQPSQKYVVESFFEKNGSNLVPGGVEGYVDVEFSNLTESNVFLNLEASSGDEVITEAGDNIVISTANGYFYGDLIVESTTAYSPQTGELRIFISANK